MPVTSPRPAGIIHGAAGRGRPSYGLDAPPVVAGFAALGLLGVAFLILTAAGPARLLGPGIGFCVVGWGTAALMLHSSLRVGSSPHASPPPDRRLPLRCPQDGRRPGPSTRDRAAGRVEPAVELSR